MIAVIQYNAGNVQSVLFALQRLGADAIVTGDEQEIRHADKVIFPGVGHAAAAMDYLKTRGLDQVITSLQQPVLGICLGLQLLCRSSEEGNTPCLGIFDTEVKRFVFRSGGDTTGKIPHMGWNGISGLSSPLMEGVPENSYVYFVHSYYAECSSRTVATTEYLVPFSAAMCRDNFYGVQFHTEKSAETGERILANFLNIR